jgi:hypothetical protein
MIKKKKKLEYKIIKKIIFFFFFLEMNFNTSKTKITQMILILFVKHQFLMHEGIN